MVEMTIEQAVQHLANEIERLLAEQDATSVVLSLIGRSISDIDQGVKQRLLAAMQSLPDTLKTCTAAQAFQSGLDRTQPVHKPPSRAPHLKLVVRNPDPKS